MTARKTQPLPFIAPTVGKVCNSNTKGYYSTAHDSAPPLIRTGADNSHNRPSRHGDCLHYRDGRITDLQGKCVAQAKHHAANNCTGNQIYSK